jgi:hypothetical protein
MLEKIGIHDISFNLCLDNRSPCSKMGCLIIYIKIKAFPYTNSVFIQKLC